MQQYIGMVRHGSRLSLRRMVAPESNNAIKLLT
jgi:hypothetical protein